MDGFFHRWFYTAHQMCDGSNAHCYQPQYFLRKPCKTFLFHGFLLEIVLDLVLYIPPPMLEATGVNWAETGQMEKKEQV